MMNRHTSVPVTEYHDQKKHLRREVYFGLGFQWARVILEGHMAVGEKQTDLISQAAGNRERTESSRKI